MIWAGGRSDDLAYVWEVDLPKVGPKSPKKSAQSRPKVGPKSPKVDPKSAQSQLKVGPKVDPKSSKSRPKGQMIRLKPMLII